MKFNDITLKKEWFLLPEIVIDMSNKVFTVKIETFENALDNSRKIFKKNGNPTFHETSFMKRRISVLQLTNLLNSS